MKHEIDITDEMCARGLKATEGWDFTKLFDEGCVHDILEAVLNPQRRWADSQREERRAVSKADYMQREDVNEAIAGVEAPHGAEESTCPYCGTLYPSARGHGCGRTWVAAVPLTYLRDGKQFYDERKGQRRQRLDPTGHIRRLGADRRQISDATRRPPNPTPETVRRRAHAPEAIVCPTGGYYHRRASDPGETLGECRVHMRAGDTPCKSSDIHVSEGMIEAGECAGLAVGSRVIKMGSEDNVSAAVYRAMELKRREEDQFRATHFQRHTRKGEAPRYWSHNRKDGAPDPFTKARAEGWQRTAVPHTRKDDHLPRTHRRKEDPK